MKEENEDIVYLKKLLKDQEKTIDSSKREIKEKKFVMEKAYQYQLIRKKEDELFLLEQQTKKLEEVKISLQRVKEDQTLVAEEKEKIKQESEQRDSLAEKLRGAY